MTREDDAITQPDLVLGEAERLAALDLWLEHIEIPAILIPLLEGVVLGHHHGELAVIEQLLDGRRREHLLMGEGLVVDRSVELADRSGIFWPRERQLHRSIPFFCG